jgi:hypothetical protein
VIQKGPGITDFPAKVNRYIGEAKFLRAVAYFDLVSMWGKVPLYDAPVTSIDGSKPRAEVADVYASIISNLTDAIAVLPAAYTGSDIGRATSGAARAVLARVYLQRGDYPDAKIQLDAIVSSGLYSLTANFNDNFQEETEYNKESIYEIGFNDNGGSNFGWGEFNYDPGLGAETTIHNQEICPTSWGNLVPSESLLSEFETSDAYPGRVSPVDAKTDPRFKFSFYKTGDTIVTGYLTEKDLNITTSVYQGNTIKIGWRKHTILYKNATNYYPSGINERTIRYAEILIDLAECQNEEAGGQAAAIATLNLVRARPSVNMPPYPTVNYPCVTKDDVFKAIVHEKRVELAGEEIRNRDILRWRANGKIPSVIPEPISYFTANKFELIPIPQREIDNNPKIGLSNQNPGY